MSRSVTLAVLVVAVDHVLSLVSRVGRSVVGWTSVVGHWGKADRRCSGEKRQESTWTRASMSSRDEMAVGSWEPEETAATKSQTVEAGQAD